MPDLFEAAPDEAGAGETTPPAPVEALTMLPPATLQDRVRELVEEAMEDAADSAAHLVPDFKPVRRNLKPATKGGSPTLLQRILKTQLAIETVAKDRKNTEFNYKYSSVDDVVGACRKALAENGVFVQITPARKRSSVIEFRNSKGRGVEMFSTITVLNAEDPEEFLEYEISGLVQTPGDKQEWVLSAQFRKYSLIELLNLERGTADDHESQRSGEMTRGDAGGISGRGGYQRPQGGRGNWQDQRSSAAPATSAASADRQPARPEIGGATKTRDVMIEALRAALPKNGNAKVISEAQAKRLFAVAGEAGYSREEVVDSLGAWFKLTPANLPWQLYEGVVNLFKAYPTSKAERREADPAELDQDVD